MSSCTLTVKPLADRQHGWLYQFGDRCALLRGDESAPLVYLRYAFLLQGSEVPIFPGLLVDDWGGERRNLSLYEWVYTEGSRFPRSEIFGYERDGSETQVFLRALETFLKLPCYVYLRRSEPVGAGRQLHTIFVLDGTHSGKPARIEVPAGTGWPLRHAAVRWRRAAPGSLAEYGWEPVDK